jgi:hypothetical protein
MSPEINTMGPNKNIVNPLSVFNKKLIQITGLYDIVSKATAFKSADLYIVYLNNLYIMNYAGYIVNKVELDTGYCDMIFMISSQELKTPSGLNMINTITKDGYYYLYDGKYIISEEDSTKNGLHINNSNFLVDSTGSIVDHFKINREDSNISGYIQVYLDIIYKFISIDLEFSRRANEVFTITDFDQNKQFASMATGRVTDGASKFIVENPSNGKKYIFILYKGISQFKKNDKVNINILDVIKQNSTDPDLFYIRIDVIRKKKIACSTYMIFINLI